MKVQGTENPHHEEFVISSLIIEVDASSQPANSNPDLAPVGSCQWKNRCVWRNFFKKTVNPVT